MTKRALIQLLDAADNEMRLTGGGWCFDNNPRSFRGCAVGNVLREISGRKDRSITERADKAIWIENGQPADGTGTTFINLIDYDATAIDRLIEQKAYLTALSRCFEDSSGDFDLFLSRVEKHFPARMMIEIDGIVPALRFRPKKKAATKKETRR